MKIVGFGLCLTFAFAAPAYARASCQDASAVDGEGFDLLWHDRGLVCITKGDAGSYRTRWSLGADGNMVAGRGWAKANVYRIIRYRAKSFDPGSNGYLSLYGWSADPLVEYYVADDYEPFVPPGPMLNFRSSRYRRWYLQDLSNTARERALRLKG